MRNSQFRINTYLFALVAAVALPLVALLGYAIYTTAQENLAGIYQDALDIARLTAANTRAFQSNAFDMLDRLVRRPLIQNAAAGRCDPVFRDFVDVNPAFANIVLANRDGFIICSSLKQKGGKPTYAGNLDWAQRTLRGERFVVATPNLGRISGKWVSILAHPIVDGRGRVRGTLGLPIDLARYQPLVSGVGLPVGSIVKIIDARGTVIAHSHEPNRWIGQLDNEPINGVALARDIGNARLRDQGDVERLYGFAVVPNSGWHVIAGIPVNAVYGPIAADALRNSLIAALIALAVLALAYAIGRRISAPTLTIARAAERVAAGDIGSRVHFRGGPLEIAEVARQLNHMLDIRQSEEASLRLLIRAIESSKNAVVISRCDPVRDHPVEYVNPTFEKITGYTSAETIGGNCRFLQNADRSQQGLEALRAAIHDRREEKVVIRNYRKDGTQFWNELHISPVRDTHGTVTHFVGILSDITESVSYRRQLEYQATHDALTGLPNRALLHDRLNQALVYAQHHDRRVVVAFVDLDQFKYINDSVGHDAGDELLKIVGARLRDAIGDGDTVARLGGDEFVLILADQSSTEMISARFEAILRATAEPVRVEGREFIITCSIGASVYPSDGTDVSTLLKNADVAMYRAKEQGRNNFQFYTREMNDAVSERMWLETNLRNALALDQFVLHYQPRISLRSGEIVGVEALIRWRMPGIEMALPDRFIPLAEETGLILPIGEWVLRTACAQARAWRDAGLPALSVAVNLSARQLRDPRLIAVIQAALTESGLRPEQLELELTETMLMTDIDTIDRTLRDLRGMGIGIAIDDFGTGYSSLSYLQRRSVDHIKIDKSFVRDLPHETGHAEIAKAIIALGHSLGLRVTAEGVEQAEQLAFLRAHRCDEAQGQYFSQPLAPEDFVTLVRTRLASGTGAAYFRVT